ncbi:MAG: type III-B CRISPR-associated protein Cas10/Cmr2 [Chlorobium sp.]|nr:type III-B CRISPR-associated protein Cas10/Cmr2 [Chlorobium sp.]
MKGNFSQDIDYWIHKTKAFLHDPPDKAIHIPGHEERANELLAAAGLVGSSLSKEEYQQADIIASGMDRATLPGYVAGDETKSGAINFCTSPQITHPTGNDGGLRLVLPTDLINGKQTVAEIAAEMRALLQEDLGTKAGSGQGLSEKKGYQGNEEHFAPARFHYLYFLLRRRLAQKDIGGLGGLWHRLPADTRLPDHSIWQHSGLVSALASSMKLSGKNQASLMVFALTPVQDFVGRARKLRDYWSGSIILSWLAFEGIKAVIQRFGADHIVYPSLHGQPLIDGLLKEWGMEEEWLGGGEDKSGVASFPNKFVCLVPTGKETEAASVIEQAISAAWLELSKATLIQVEKTIGREDSYIKEQFERQLHNYWEHHWAAVPLVKGDDRCIVEELLHKETIHPAFDFWEKSNKFWQSTGEGQLYSVSHRLVQAMLAAGKSQRQDIRIPEEGIKCDLFGEFEILHYEAECGKNPKPSDDPFWKDVRNKFDESDFGKNERLCALGIVKRLAYRVCKQINGHPLQKMFKNAETFPSTTEMALHDWWRQLQNKAKNQDDRQASVLAKELAIFNKEGDTNKTFQKLAQWLHELNEPESAKRQGCEIPTIVKNEKKAAQTLFKLHPVKDVHKYYAVLMMDGDKMGKLINGETLGATWQNVLHPELVRRLAGKFDGKFKKFWNEWMTRQRIISPAVHAAISEALGDFSLLTVPYIIEKKYHGRLIYAGGDDVCAVLPASTVLAATKEIAAAYGMGFITARAGLQSKAIAGEWKPESTSKLGLHLGRGEGISISAGIMIAHHKKPLGRVMSRAHELLNLAKNEGGRNGFALEVDKRSGGGRIFRAGWQEEKDGFTLLDHFLATADALQASEQAAMSSSLAYRLTTFKDGLLALVDNQPEQLGAFIAKQLDRSILNAELSQDEKKEQLQKLAGHVAALINRKSSDGRLPLESIIVANFIGHCHRQGGSI